MIKAHLEQVVATLQSYGIPAAYDPLKLHPPCAWVHARRIVGARLDGSLLMETVIYLIAPELDIPEALVCLEDLLSTLLPKLQGMLVDTDLGTTVTLPSGAVCPAYALTITPEGSS